MRKLSVISFMLFFVFGCGKPSSGPAAERREGRIDFESSTQTPYDETETLQCLNSKVIEILKGGSLYVTRENEDDSILVLKEKDKFVEKSSLLQPSQYHTISPNGAYLVNQVSYRRYQLLNFANNQFEQRATPLTFYSVDNPDIHFSKNSHYLVIKYKPASSRNVDLVTIYDVERREFLKSFRYENVRYADVSNDLKYLYLGIEEGTEKRVVKLDYKTEKKIFDVKLPNRNGFNAFIVLKNHIITNDSGRYAFLSSQTGEVLYRKNMRHIYDWSQDESHLLIAPNWNEMAVINLQTGDSVVKADKHERVYASSCKLTSNTTILCRDSAQSGKLVSLDLDSMRIEESCY